MFFSDAIADFFCRCLGYRSFHSLGENLSRHCSCLSYCFCNYIATAFSVSSIWVLATSTTILTMITGPATIADVFTMYSFAA